MTTCRLFSRLTPVSLLWTAACAQLDPALGEPVLVDSMYPGPVPAEWDEGTITADGRPVTIECPNISPVDREGTGSAAFHDSTVAMPLAGEIQQIPEYHDCQRLTTQRLPGRFGPLVGIFAREALGEIDEEAFRQQSGVPVGQIYNFSDIPYGPLGLGPGYSCLYLRLDQDNVWHARLRWRDKDARCPGLTPLDWQGSGGLTVRRDSQSPDPAHYPAVARWDRDWTNRLHYIGIKCLDGWCEIGRGAFASSPKYAHPDHTGRIKAWYDEQQLAEITTRKMMLPGVQARIVPVPGLDTLTVAHYSCQFPCPRTSGWIHVATTWLEGPSPFYRTQLNFAPGSRGNTIHLRRHVKTSGEERWESRIISANGDTTFHRTLRVDHTASGPGPNPIVPPTARWHWRENDETTWTRCAVGCCESTTEKIAVDAF